VASRKEEKERLRAERVAQEQAEAQAASRRRRTALVFGGLVVAAAIVVAVVLAVSGGGGSGGSTTTTSGGSGSGALPAAATVGVQATPPPWQPEYSHLAERLKAMDLPKLNEQIFHIHSLLRVYVNGDQVTVPAEIGLDAQDQVFSPLHTHDTSGIIHMEADQKFPFTLGEFFAVWGVKFSNDGIGSFTDNGNDTLQVYVNGKKISDPVNYVMQEHDNIVVGFGKPGSFPTNPPANFPPGT
jgi:hypothetical protein